MKTVQWIEIHQESDIIRCNVQDGSGVGEDMTIALSVLPAALGDQLRGCVRELTGYLGQTPEPVDAERAIGALSGHLGVALVTEEDKDAAVAAVREEKDEELAALRQELSAAGADEVVASPPVLEIVKDS